MAGVDYHKELSALVDIIMSEGASDIHLAVGTQPTVRVTGSLIPLVKKPTLTNEDVLGFASVVMSPDQLETFMANQELDFSYQHADVVRFRGNAFVQKGHPSLVMRTINRQIRSFAELGLPPVLEAFATQQQGFFLCVGPVGQGKSTTLAAMIEVINQNKANHIVTIEDPVEYVYEPKQSLINQREVGIDTKDFNTALSAALRQDIDVLLVGEMRDTDTIATAVTAAETGHMVFSTLHTNNATQTVDRIIDTFPAGQQNQIRGQLAGSLSGILSQRLVPRISGGVVPAYELLINNTAVSNLIRESRTHELQTVVETGIEHGMMDMNRSLLDLVKKGEITRDNAFAYSTDPKGLDRLM